MKRPASLTIAVVLQYISAILGLIAGGAMFLSGLAAIDPEARRAFEDVMAQQGITGVTGADIGIGLAMIGVLIVAISVVRLIIAISLGRGRNWARVVITVFALLSMLMSVGQLFGGDAINILGGAVGIAIEVVILWLMWNGASSAYIRERTAVRKAVTD
jgi:lipid-A-disaccharide synthase-like uncharacterized protein